MNTQYPTGTHVLVSHGVGAWPGTVTTSHPGYLIVAYPHGCGHQEHELVDLTRHHVQAA